MKRSSQIGLTGHLKSSLAWIFLAGWLKWSLIERKLFDQGQVLMKKSVESKERTSMRQREISNQIFLTWAVLLTSKTAQKIQCNPLITPVRYYIQERELITFARYPSVRLPLPFLPQPTLPLKVTHQWKLYCEFFPPPTVFAISYDERCIEFLIRLAIIEYFDASQIHWDVNTHAIRRPLYSSVCCLVVDIERNGTDYASLNV